MWKGYREAQCGFIEVTEAKSQTSENRRSGLFLIIYAPRKALIEIWSLQKGPKVATFQASKNGFLLYNSQDASQHKSSRNSKAMCVFFDADDGCLKNFSIPFHCILSESNSQSAEDFHYLKRLKMTLKHVDLKEDSGINTVIEICEKFQTSEIKLKCLELLTSFRRIEPQVIKAVIDYFLKNPEAETESLYANQLNAACLNYQSLINCYLMTKETSDDVSAEVKNEQMQLSDNEYLTVKRMMELFALISFNETKRTSSSIKNVSFKDNEESIVTFLSSFAVNLGDSILISNENYQTALDQIGMVLFTNVWKQRISPSQLLNIFETSRIDSEDIMKCFLHFWFNQEIDFSDEDQVLIEMEKFHSILEKVCASTGDKGNYAYNQVSTFWQNVREYLLESNFPVNSLLAAIICKNFALKKQDESADFGFEQVTQEECQWTLLTEKLNDVAVLSIFVSQFGAQKKEMPSISLKKVLNEGKGIISELVASWLINNVINIDLVFKTTEDEGLETQDKNVIKKLEILRQHFPYSCNGAVILCYCIWENIAKWSKNLSEIQHLKAGVNYLSLFPEKYYQLKHGLCLLLWNANIKIPLKAIQKLINKAGSLPKEKLCLQSTMIPDFLIAQFLEQTIIFLDHFRDSSKYNCVEFKCEEILKQGSSASSLSLCERILQQPRGNLPLLNLHYEMVKVLELIAFLNIKYTKPMQSLFDDVSNEGFFIDINKQLIYTIQKADEIRMNTRSFFLKKAVSMTIDLIIECQQSTYFDDHLRWIEKIMKVAEIWEIDVSLLERHHVSFYFVLSCCTIFKFFFPMTDSRALHLWL